MSQKNHKMTDGKLLQMDKKYAQLKLKQKEKIAEWMFQATRDYYTKNYTFEGADKILDYYRASKGAFLCIQKNKRILHYGYIIKQSL